MIRQRNLVAAVIAIAVMPVLSYAAVTNPTNLAWRASLQRVSTNSERCLLTSNGYLAGSLAFPMGNSFSCGFEMVARPGRSASIAQEFAQGGFQFAAIGNYDFSSEFHYTASDNEVCQAWVSFDNTVVRPWTANQYGYCWNDTYTVYDIILGTPHVVVTSAAQQCGSGSIGDRDEGLDDLGNMPRFVYIDLSQTSLPTQGEGSAEFMIALKHKVTAEANPGQTAGVLWKEASGLLHFITGEDLARIPTTNQCGGGDDDTDPVRRRPPVGGDSNSHQPRSSWGQVKSMYR
jgi:hypothetical protein